MALRTLKPYQKVALREIIAHRGRFGLFLAPGTGKTAVAIRYAKRFKRILVVCRRDDFLTWREELHEEQEGDLFAIESRDSLDMFHTAAGSAWDPSDFKYWLISYGLLRNKGLREWIRSFGFKIVIADESHYAKRYKSQQTKALLKVAKDVRHRIAMTGSAVTENVEDVFTQGLFIDGGKTFGTNWWRFMQRYFIRLPTKAWVPKRGQKQTIIRKLRGISMHVHEDDVLKLPPKRYVVKGAEMSKSQRKEYDRILEEWEYQIDSGEPVEIDQVVVQVSKLRQVAGGFLYPPKNDYRYVDQKPPPNETRWFKCPKIDLLVDMLKKGGMLEKKRKIVVWCAFTAEIERISEQLQCHHGIKCVKYYGSKRKDKEAARLAFRDDANVRVFIGQADSGVGMNQLTVADVAVYYSNSYRVVSRQQSERRIRRMGSEGHASILYVDLVTEGSLDMGIARSVRDKVDFAQSILDGLKRGQRPRNLV